MTDDMLRLVKEARATLREILDDDGFNATLPSSVRQRLRQAHAALDAAVAAGQDAAP